jgi:hypothetical protein
VAQRSPPRAGRRRCRGARFGDDRSYTLRFDGQRWSRQRGEAVADVVVETSPEGWVRFLAADRRRAAPLARQVAGERGTQANRGADVSLRARTRRGHMKLGTSVRFLFPTSPATHERFRSLLA